MICLVKPLPACYRLRSVLVVISVVSQKKISTPYLKNYTPRTYGCGTLIFALLKHKADQLKK